MIFRGVEGEFRLRPGLPVGSWNSKTHYYTAVFPHIKYFQFWPSVAQNNPSQPDINTLQSRCINARFSWPVCNCEIPKWRVFKRFTVINVCVQSCSSKWKAGSAVVSSRTSLCFHTMINSFFFIIQHSLDFLLTHVQHIISTKTELVMSETRHETRLISSTNRMNKAELCLFK